MTPVLRVTWEVHVGWVGGSGGGMKQGGKKRDKVRVG